MKLSILAVGRIKKPAPSRVLLDDYLGRINKFCACEEIELKDGKGVADKMLQKASGASLIAMEIGGEQMSSKALARRLERLASRGKGVVAFAIGGADGLPAAVREAATAEWSLSRLTLPHRLARVLLAEQLYRALTILRNPPYDH